MRLFPIEGMKSVTFKSFVINELDPHQTHPRLSSVIELVKSDRDFPDTVDMDTMARYLYLQLDYRQTLSYQKLLMIWTQLTQPSLIEQPDFLEKINGIIDL